MASSVRVRRLVAGLGTALVIALSFPTAGTLPVSGLARLIISAIGSVTLYVSVALGAAIHRSYPDRHDEPRDTGRLFTEGPYELCRHPFYLFMILVQFSIPLVLVSAPGLVLAAGLLPAWSLLVRIEERELLEYWGEAYREYMRRTPALIPSLGRLLRQSRAKKHVYS